MRAGLLLLGLAWLAAPAVRAADAFPATVEVDVLSRLRPTALDLAGAGGSALEVVLRTEDGREERIRAGTLHVRCEGLEVVAWGDRGARRSAAEVRARPARGAEHLRVSGGGFATRRYPGGRRGRRRAGPGPGGVEVPFERYVSEVACRELGPSGAGREALRAQAVVVRTYALTRLGHHRADGADFCDLTHCQVYPGEGACRPADLEALRAVDGLVLLDGARPAEVAYFSTCGGHTARAGEVWGPRSARPWLEGVPDGDEERPACRASPHGPWRLRLTRAELCAALREAHPGLGPGLCSLASVETGEGGWVRRVVVEAAGRWELTGDEFRLVMGRRFGWNAFKSGRWSVSERAGQVLFRGQGLGHGVGLCQHGALGMAKEGASFEAILGRYFPGLRVGRLP